MEPHLDRLLDYEAQGALFPQFGAEWKSVFVSALEMRDTIAVTGTRPRVAIRCRDEESFCAWFLAFARSEVDLFFFNPSWGSVEQKAAEQLVSPHWILKDVSQGRLLADRVRAVEAGEALEERGMRVMIPTGGTSGAVKMAMHDWGTLSASAYGFQMFFNANTVSSHCLLPLYHVSGFMQLARSLLTLGTIVFGSLDTFSASHAALNKACGEKPYLSLVATQLERLLRDESNVSLLAEYEAIFVGGGPVSVGLLERCRDLKLPMAPTYGLTETAAQVATLKPWEFGQGMAGQGKPLPHARIAIVSEEGDALAANEEGRIQVYGTSICHGYWGESEDYSRSLITADLGRLDQLGRLTVLGRVDRVVISGGEKINLREVEIVFEETGLVSDVATFGVKDAEWGTLLGVAYVPVDTAVTEEALQEHVKERLAAYKVPKRWERRERLPRNEAGKLVMSDW